MIQESKYNYQEFAFKRKKIKHIYDNFELDKIFGTYAQKTITLFRNILEGSVPEEIKTKDIVIKNNDTIWNIASDICDENDSLNIQNVVIQIKQINNMTTSDLYIGQQLKIPIY